MRVKLHRLPFVVVSVALGATSPALADAPDLPPPGAPPPWRGPPPSRRRPPPPSLPPQEPPQQPPGAPATAVNAELILLHGTNAGTGIDPRIGRMPALSKPPFSAYNSYELLRRDGMPLSLGRASVTKLPNHGDLIVTLQGIAPPKKGEPKKYIVNVSIQKRGNVILPLLQLNATAGEMFYGVVPGYRGGIIVIGIRIS